LLEGKWPAGIFAFDPGRGFAKQRSTSAAPRAEIFLKAFDGVRQNRKHESFFRPKLTFLLIHFEVPMRGQDVWLEKGTDADRPLSGC